MTDHQNMLEHELERLSPPKIPLDQLARRRDRKRRDQRIRAGALGVIVALATGLVLVRSLTSEPIPADPPVVLKPAPAAPGTLTYSMDGDIYVADPDGLNAVKIVNGRPCNGRSDGRSYWAQGPTMWSPDGRYLAYRYYDCSNEESGGGVVISDWEGNVLATFPTGGWDVGWSPDSTRVAVWDVTFETIGVYGLDGARQTQLTPPSGWAPSGDYDPRWMPGGTSVLIEDWELPLDGSTPRLLPILDEPYPTFSPDGSLVAYTVYNSAEDQRTLMVARSDGAEPREMFRGGADPVWSPTGDRIAFIANGLRVIDVATGAVTLLTEEERGTNLRVMGFSPEGDRVLFSTIDSDSLWSIGVDGSDASLVVAGTWVGEWAARTTDQPTSADARPTPAPAASGTLAYDLDGDIYVADPDGSNAVRVTNGLPPEDCRGDTGEYWAEGSMWSPDGRYLAYRHDTDCSDLASWPDVEISDAEGNVITTFPAQGWGIAWSPDSTRVAVWDRLYEPPATIGIYGLDGARQTQLTMPPGWSSGDNFDEDPAWMPDGTLRVHNMEMPLDGSTPRQLLPQLPALPASMMSYSPDGSRVAYVDDGDRSLVVAAADGSDAREVVGPFVLDPVWSPTGDRIAFTYSERKDVYRSNELRVLDVATGEVTPLVGMGRRQDIWNIQFSPEGDRIVFVGGEPAGEPWGLWSIGVDGSDLRLVVAGTINGDWLSR